MAPHSGGDLLLQLMPLTLLAVLSIIPSIKLLNRVGKSWAWSMLTIWPLVGQIVLLWVVAYSRWELPSASKNSN
jgi:uncharacterized membrane protein YhaH (DUF805 family)